MVGGGPLSEVSVQTQQMMLWANALNWMWRPTERVQRIGQAILCKYKVEEPLVSVHIRRTDKEVEVGHQSSEVRLKLGIGQKLGGSWQQSEIVRCGKTSHAQSLGISPSVRNKVV